jgi:hypothetical protein
VSGQQSPIRAERHAEDRARIAGQGAAVLDALSRVLKGQPPAAAGTLEGTFEINRSLPHGHVAAVLGTLRDLGLEELSCENAVLGAKQQPEDLASSGGIPG